MKESMGGTQIMILVILLVLIFAGLMSFTINHSNAFAIKDQLVSVIEKYGGFDLQTEITGYGNTDSHKALEEMVDLISASSYRQKGTCPQSTSSMTVSSYQRNGQMTLGNDKASFCIAKIKTNNANNNYNGGALSAYSYQVIVFYNLDLPALNSFFNFRAVGETKVLYS